MSEAAEKGKQFDYGATSNLVITSENRTRESGPTGEVTSIAGKQSTRDMIKKMGDRQYNEKSDTLQDRLSKSRKKRDLDMKEGADLRKRRRGDEESVLTAVVETIYQPKTRETKAAYEVLLAFIQKQMGDQPHDVLRSCADEVLAVLKDENLKQKEKQSQIARMLSVSKIEEEPFSRLVTIGGKITDYKTAAEIQRDKIEGETIDEDLGVPVVFEEMDEEEEDMPDDIRDDSGDEDIGVEAQKSYAIVSKLDENMVDVDEEKENEIDARTIDAFWLQRQFRTFYKDALQSQKMADDVFELLASDEPDNKCENQMVLLLNYDKFNFIKKLLRNRLKVTYCIKLARAKTATDRKVLEEEMLTNDKLRPILEALRKTSTAADRNMALERDLIKEARNLGLTRDRTNLSKTTDVFWNKQPKALVDLESLSFEGGHFMSNAECKLPKKSEVINKKGYQEVHIPPLKTYIPKSDEQLIKIKDLPEWAQNGFKGMKTLNTIQSRVFPTAFNTPANLLICAPTGAGKTNVAMLTMMREIGRFRNENGEIDTDAFKIVYVAPMKSLVQEMVMNFGKRLAPYGVNVAELSGDQQLTKQQINQTQVIITTPEKWDIITRKAGDRTYTQLVKLIIIDEIHLLHDSRGPVLESLIARTIRQIESTQEMVRMVGLSATLPNYEDVALFLRVKPDEGLFFFDNSYRPCPLQQQYIGITQKKAFKRHQLMNEITYEKVTEAAGKNQVLVFVHSRKETANTARFLREMAVEKEEIGKFLKEESGRRELLQAEAENVKSDDLRELLPFGFAIHHAGMHRSDRTTVEELFADNHIQVLVSTATLAWGVNLPAHTVIIKGTQVYNPEKGMWDELSPMDVTQMHGRAGRPQYDTFGEGIIITSHKELHYYLSLLNEQLPVESQFVTKLADNLNAEVVLGTVQNVKEAVDWLSYTYLYVRMLRAPTLYGLSAEDLAEDPTLEQRRIDLIHTAATILDKHNLMKYDRKSGTFQVTDLGKVASHYYITHQTMAVYNEYLKPNMSDIELFRVFSLSSEFKHMSVREEEKVELAKLLDKVPIPVKESIEEASAKTNVLLQTYISRLTLEGFALTSDMVYVTQSAGRLMRALFEIVLRRGWAAVAVKCLNLCKMVQHRMWGAQSPLRQFKGIPADIIKRIEGKDFPWERFYDLEAHAIGELIRFPKMGKRIHKCVHHLPRLDLQGHVQPITRTVLKVELTITPDFQFDTKVHSHSEPFWIIVEDVDGDTILHHEYFILKKNFAMEEHVINFTIPIFDPLPPQYYVRVLSDRWLGSEVVLPISFRHLILPERYPAPTELLDLQPLPTNDLQSERFINFYKGRFDYFNPIQTQVFNTIYKKDDNVLVAAPTGSGKTVVAELAIMRMLAQNPKGRCVYIAPLDSLAKERYLDWKEKMGRRIGLEVVELTGETTADLKLLQEGQIVVATPQKWDVMSRRWKTRKSVQEVKLFIVDELHLIGGDVGPVLEVIVSRMRYISTQTENPCRIVGLSTSVANAKDLGEWIGAKNQSCFNFHPNVRPVPLEIRVQGFDINHFESRQLAMIKPSYLAIKHHAEDKPVIMFVHSRTQARRLSIDLMTYASAEGEDAKFLKVDLDDIKPHLEHIKDPSLKECLSHGVGYYHAGLSDRERAVVERLYDAGAIQVVVSEFSLCWGMTMAAHMVVIMGTQYYDGRDHRYVDCPITDVVQMMGRASRPLLDSNGKCTIFCQTSKKEFYKKFLYEPFPVESHLDHYLADHMNAEIITKRINSVQDAVDYVTWSFFYRRLTQNPNYYNLQGVSHSHLSDYLSELVENTLDDLQQSKCITVEDDDAEDASGNVSVVSPLNLGMIASHYYIKYTTVEAFSSLLTKKTKLRGLLEILAAATEFESIQVRHREDYALKKLAHHLPLKISNPGSYNDAATKTNILLQAYFSRIPLAAAVASDQEKILPEASRLLQAIVDVISSNGWLSPALAAMEMSQMVTQGLWNTDSSLLQLPHVDKMLAKKCVDAGVEGIPDIIDMEDSERNDLLGLKAKQMQDVARVCNVYPDVEVKHKVLDHKDIHAGGRVVVSVDLIRDPEDEDDGRSTVPKVSCARYPTVKTEGWWLVVGNPSKNELIGIKRVAMKKKTTNIKLDFLAPDEGKHKYMLYLMCDSYIGCDQEYDFSINVLEGEAASSSDDDSDSD